MQADSRIYIAGHRGMVGSAIVRRLRKEGYGNLILRTSNELDLRNQAAVGVFFVEEKPEYVFLAAARVGGIHANNTYPADFIRDNLQIQTNVIDAACQNKVRKLLFLGSSCIYPKMAPQPLREEYLLTGSLEPTNEWYAIAKIAGIKMCQAYRRQYGFDAICAMPTNLYGPNDNFDLETSHVLPAMIRKFHEARERKDNQVVLWGTGSPRREFLHVDDLADACLFLMALDSSHLTPHPSRLFNIGVGEDVTIRELAELVQGIVGFEGEIVWDDSKPDGTPRKLMDVSRLHGLGWQAKTPLTGGIADVYRWYCQSCHSPSGTL
ncbi:MAG: GDP-L-fucose synthase [Zetaproteobacteria bacterium]|nr:MAG: GDP-L-fucose synthase [Zetaproteobacteria bacterium]